MRNTAGYNFEALRGNPYPGRGIVVGLDETGKFLVQLYWIMGRSPNSRNRVFSHDGNGRVFTEAADPAKVEDPSLIIYNAMREVTHKGENHLSVVSNGAQTDAIIENSFCLKTDTLRANIKQWTYEPDAPNFTPRITTASMWMKYATREVPFFQISILRKSWWSKACDRHLYEIDGVGSGFGYCVTTYLRDGHPLPAFQGEPFPLPLRGDIRLIADEYWEALNPDNKVSLAVKFIPKKGPSDVVIINKYARIVHDKIEKKD
jgi:hypothetical protein